MGVGIDAVRHDQTATGVDDLGPGRYIQIRTNRFMVSPTQSTSALIVCSAVTTVPPLMITVMPNPVPTIEYSVP